MDKLERAKSIMWSGEPVEYLNKLCDKLNEIIEWINAVTWDIGEPLSSSADFLSYDEPVEMRSRCKQCGELNEWIPVSVLHGSTMSIWACPKCYNRRAEEEDPSFGRPDDPNGPPFYE